MNQMNKPVFALKALVLCLGLAAGASSWAETPLGLVISETLTYDTNIFKDDRNKRSDVVSSTGVKVFFDKQYGRQRYNASVQGVLQRYKNADDYNNDGYQIEAGLTSQIASNGVVSIDHSRTQTLQDVAGQGLTRYKETLTQQNTAINGRYGLYGRWGLSGALTNDEIRYERNDEQDQSINGVRVGLRYSPSDLLFLDVGYRKANSKLDKYPSFFVNENNEGDFRRGDDIDRDEINLISQWVVTGYSVLDAQIGWTRERHNPDSARDFTGLTGRAAWKFTPRGKTSYYLAVNRDTNNAGGQTYITEIIPGIAGTGQLAQKRLTTGLRGTATWQATAKIAANLSLIYNKLDEERNLVFAVNGRESLSGSYRALSLGLRYDPTQNLGFSCDLTSYKRSETALSLGYGGESIACTASFAIE